MGSSVSKDLEDTYNVENAKKKDLLTFYLHGSEHSVKTENLTPETSLNTYIRKILHLTGTKGMCYEGGCGCCVVAIQFRDPFTGKDVLESINSCLMPVLACSGAKIYTSEGIGNPVKGYHPIQKVLAKFNGTQCGFCSPGMVMNMYSLYETGKLTMKEVEDSFGGNICRCTGYRPILSGFKSLCSDASADVLGICPDIEDLKVCPKNDFIHVDKVDCLEALKEPFYHTLGDESKWIKVYQLQDLLKTIDMLKNSSYRLVAGNTAQGAYKAYKDPVDVYIDVTSVTELVEHKEQDNNYILGGNITLTNAIKIFKKIGEENTKFAYFTKVADHINLVANLPVRNRATLAGNLMIKHDHQEFPSDVFLLLETLNATITIVSAKTNERTQLKLRQFINYDMRFNVLLKISLPSYSDSYKFISYKIMPRAQNTHAIVNAGFLFKLRQDQTVESSTIVYGNISKNFVRASGSEKLLIGKNLFDNRTLQAIYASLSNELIPDKRPPDPSPETRKQIAIALFYKAVLSIAPAGKVSAKNASGGALLERPLSTGVQDYETKESLYPLTEAIPKLEALAQTSGRATFIDDMPNLPYQLFGVLVLAKAAPGSTIKSVDASKALKVDGVVAFYDKHDIPGDNNFTPIMTYFVTVEEIFCSGKILYYDQPLGVVVGHNEKTLEKAAGLVQVVYGPPSDKPVLSIPQVLKENRTDRITKFSTVEPKRKGTDVRHVIKGNFHVSRQYHFYMETVCCNVIPKESLLEVYPSTQYMDLCQVAIANMLKIPSSKVLVIVQRCGGGFGGKVSRSTLVACAAALAAWKLKAPVKVVLPLSTNMRALGKRFPLYTNYEVGVDDQGVVQYLDCTLYSDNGAVQNEDSSSWVIAGTLQTYNSETYKLQLNKVRTDTPTNTWMRAPGTTESISNIENIMDQIAYKLNKDPLEVRRANFLPDSPFFKYADDMVTWADLNKRKQDIESFNKTNRWKKKGLSVTVMNFEFEMDGPFFAMLTIFHYDGSVQITHGGVEIGQGINTKAAQVCAYKLGIPVNQVFVVPSNTFTTGNNAATGDTKTSEAVCYGIIQACDVLLARIKPYRDQLPANATWKEIINKCQDNFVNLTANGLYSPKEKGVSRYPIYGICATEVLLDILTGQHYITRTDIIEDSGQVINPVIDIGQIEGAFVMGLGYYTTERIVYDEQGRLLTDTTWTYYPPGFKDIPADFKIKIPKDNPNPLGVLKSKGTGEPPLCLSISVALAIRNALASARTDADPSTSKWYPIDGPTDLENVVMNTLSNFSQYNL